MIGADVFVAAMLLTAFIYFCAYIALNYVIERFCGIRKQSYPLSRIFFVLSPVIGILVARKLEELLSDSGQHHIFVVGLILYSIIVLMVCRFLIFKDDMKRVKSIAYILLYQTAFISLISI
jgi:hypothetical protein